MTLLATDQFAVERAAPGRIRPTTYEAKRLDASFYPGGNPPPTEFTAWFIGLPWDTAVQTPVTYNIGEQLIPGDVPDNSVWMYDFGEAGCLYGFNQINNTRPEGQGSPQYWISDDGLAWEEFDVPDVFNPDGNPGGYRRFVNFRVPKRYLKFSGKTTNEASYVFGKTWQDESVVTPNSYRLINFSQSEVTTEEQFFALNWDASLAKPGWSWVGVGPNEGYVAYNAVVYDLGQAGCRWGWEFPEGTTGGFDDKPGPNALDLGMYVSADGINWREQASPVDEVQYIIEERYLKVCDWNAIRLSRNSYLSPDQAFPRFYVTTIPVVTTYQVKAYNVSMSSSFASFFASQVWDTTSVFSPPKITLQINEPIDTNTFIYPSTYWMYDFGVPGCFLGYDESYDKKNGLIQISDDGITYRDFGSFDNDLVNIRIPARYAKLWPEELADTRNCICTSGPVSASLYSLQTQNLMANLEDSDLMLVCRSGVPYKATGAEIKDSLGSGSINPGLNDITLDPATPGSGTEADPYILQGQVVAPFGSTAESVETITIIGQPPEASVVWKDNSVDAGNRFAQVTGELTDANGVWTGKLEYADIPDSTEDTVYVGKLNIGLVYFQWTITQKAVATSPTVITNVSLVESSPAEGDRFTSQSFVASSQVTDGVPTSVKTFDAHVDGTLSKQVKFDEPLESSGTTPGPDYSDNVTSAIGFGQPPSNGFDGSLSTSFQSSGNTSSGTELYRFTLTQDVADEWNQASQVTWYQVPGNGTAGSSSISILRNGTIDLWNSAASDSSPMPLYGATGPITNWVAGDYLYVTNQTGSQGRGRCYGISYTIGGVETFLVDGVSQTALTFPTNTDMEALAEGDAISQVSNFTEPLESSSTVTNNYTPLITSSNGFNPTSPPANAFDGDTVTYAQSNQNGALTFNATGLGYKNCRVRVYMNSAQGQQNMYDDTGATWTYRIISNGNPYGGDFYGFEANITGDVFNMVSQGLNNNGGYFGWIQFDDEPPLENGPGNPSLIFSAATDMAALAPGDGVSQAAGEKFPATIWSDSASSSGTITDASFAFNGASSSQAVISPPQSIFYVTLPGPFTGKVFIRQSGTGVASGRTITYYTGIGGVGGTVTSTGFGTNADVVFDVVSTSTFGIADLTQTDDLRVAEVRLDGEVLVDGQPVLLPAPSGTVGSITGTTATLTSSAGAWVNGVDVTTGNKTTSGTVSGVSGTTAILSSSAGAWVNGLNVVGPQKTIIVENARLYCAFDSSGNITDLQDNPQDPPYTTQDSNPGLTFTFPATFPSGQTPDDELPDGTTFTVEVSAENSTSTSGPISATVQPEPGAVDPPLTGLTRLYPGNSSGQDIVIGINLDENGGLVWSKCRTSDNAHFLWDTERGICQTLSTNSSTEQSTFAEGFSLTQFNNDGWTFGQNRAGENSTGDNYVAWTFGKAAGYFDVVTYTGNGSSTGDSQIISHDLGSIPGFVIIKRTSDTGEWVCWHSSISTGQPRKYIQLNSPNGTGTMGADIWGTVNSTVLEVKYNGTVGDSYEINKNGQAYVAYFFAEDTPGVIKCGSAPGTGQVELGFKPQWVLVKTSTTAENWFIFDSKRGDGKDGLYPNENNTEIPNWQITFNDTGFNSQLFAAPYIYVAIAAPPIARSQTNEEFVESQAKFLTYDNRKQVKQGEEALNDREGVIKQAADLGLDVSQIKKLIGK